MGHLNAFRQHEPGLIGIGTQPTFAIGQRALLVCTPNGNVLWDCISLIDEATVTLINGLGGLKAIAISHPHFYTTLVEWSSAFGNVPVHLHAEDSAWVMRPDPCIEPWRGETLELLPGVTLVRGGGHFPGGAMLHWAQGAEGRGVVCSADIATVNLDRKSFTFMRSYPNNIPLSAQAVRTIGAALEPFRFDRVYSHFFDRVVRRGQRRFCRPPLSVTSRPSAVPTIGMIGSDSLSPCPRRTGSMIDEWKACRHFRISMYFAVRGPTSVSA